MLRSSELGPDIFKVEDDTNKREIREDPSTEQSGPKLTLNRKVIPLIQTTLADFYSV